MTDITWMYDFTYIFLNFIQRGIILGCIIIGFGLIGIFFIKLSRKTLNYQFRVNLLRFGFWAGAIVDFFAFFSIMASSFSGIYSGNSVNGTTSEYRFASGWGASLMLGWTILLIWADRKPIERKIIIFFTVVPVIIGILLTNLLTSVSWIDQLIGFGLFLFCYVQSINLEKAELSSEDSHAEMIKTRK